MHSIIFRFVGSLIALLLSTLLLVHYISNKILLAFSFLDARLLLFPLFLFLGIKAHRSTQPSFSFIQGLLWGLYMSLLSALGMFLFFQTWAMLDAHWVTVYIQQSIELLEKNSIELQKMLGEKVYQEQWQELHTTTALHIGLDYGIKSIAMGALFSIIFAIALRKNSL